MKEYSLKERIRKLIRTRINCNLNFVSEHIYPVSCRLDHKTKKYRFAHSYFNLEMHSYESNSFEKNSKEKLCRQIFDERRHRFIYEAFGTEPVYFEDIITFESIPDSFGNYRYTCNNELESKDFKLISSVEKHKYKASLHTGDIFDDISDDAERECDLSYRLRSIDYFRGKISVSAGFTESDNICPDVICEGSSIACYVYALKKHNNFPVWVELLITSFAFDDAGNTRMAFFSAFSALDSLIETQYAELSSVYKEQIMNRKCSSEIFDYLYERYTKYRNFQRRLIREKYKDVMNELTGNTEGISDLCDKLYKFEDMRHDIAHGKKTEISREDFMNLVYSIMNVIYIMKYGNITDILKKETGEIIAFSPLRELAEL
ncbi:MAG: hypothetical protein II884_10650 [Synergistaceae bacterium]|nr:hypothetical protein [Synergistaceae bacterium]MBQ3695213.1 hypothetical protein [Synergistaceae bacterium]